MKRYLPHAFFECVKVCYVGNNTPFQRMHTSVELGTPVPVNKMARRSQTHHEAVTRKHKGRLIT